MARKKKKWKKRKKKKSSFPATGLVRYEYKTCVMPGISISLVYILVYQNFRNEGFKKGGF